MRRVVGGVLEKNFKFNLNNFVESQKRRAGEVDQLNNSPSTTSEESVSVG